jgi:hypothetical protein
VRQDKVTIKVENAYVSENSKKNIMIPLLVCLFIQTATHVFESTNNKGITRYPKGIRATLIIRGHHTVVSHRGLPNPGSPGSPQSPTVGHLVVASHQILLIPSSGCSPQPLQEELHHYVVVLALFAVAAGGTVPS